MQHNSFGKHDLLLPLNNEPLVRARREPHRNVSRNPDATAGEGQFLLDNSWQVECVTGDACEQLVAADLTDFLQRLDVVPATNAERKIRFQIGAVEEGFRIWSTPASVEVAAADAGSLWAALVHLENEMRAAGGPILPIGETKRVPAWEVQICPPAWGANFFVPDLTPEFLGDENFRAMAHNGINGMLLYGDFLAYATGTSIPELEHPNAEKHLSILREAVQRALPYGIRFYYVPVSPKLEANHPLFERCPGARGALLQRSIEIGQHIHCLCSSNEDALAYHADVMRKLFLNVPELGGIITIVGGESYYHCFMFPAHAAHGETSCPNCAGKLAEDVVANFLRVTADAVKQSQPDAHIMVWPYSAHGWSREPDQLSLIERLPKNTVFFTEVDKDQIYQKDGYTKAIWDYSVDFDGCSDRAVAQALACERNDLDIFIKTETAHGIELLHLPYVPCLGRSARKWQSVRTLRPRGVLQRWGFVGMFDSVAEKVGYEACWNPHFTPQQAIETIASRFMGEAAPQVVQAWNDFDRAVGHIPILVLGNYYIGPMFLGPIHPLPVWDGETPDAFRGHLYYLVEMEATFSNTYIQRRDDLTLHNVAQLHGVSLELLIKEFTAARDLSKEACQILDDIDTNALPSHQLDEVKEQHSLGEYLYRTFRTTLNTLLFLRDKEAGADRSTLQAVARDELHNSHAAQRIYEAAPWLNHRLRLDVGVPDSTGVLREKIRLLEEFLAQ